MHNVLRLNGWWGFKYLIHRQYLHNYEAYHIIYDLTLDCVSELAWANNITQAGLSGAIHLFSGCMFKLILINNVVKRNTSVTKETKTKWSLNSITNKYFDGSHCKNKSHDASHASLPQARQQFQEQVHNLTKRLKTNVAFGRRNESTLVYWANEILKNGVPSCKIQSDKLAEQCNPKRSGPRVSSWATKCE